MDIDANAVALRPYSRRSAATFRDECVAACQLLMAGEAPGADRAREVSWAAIAGQLGVSRQAAWERFS